mmetsp:Transcript_11212/g.19146  ORF Transcript_11212/g.19146 Transcript_11212/m.19146 type:complete len:231 (-) Transcript_11212:173-865(-)
MRRASDFVQDYPSQVQAWIEQLEPFDERCYAAPHGPAVEHKYDRSIEPLRHLRGAASVRVAIQAIEEAHNPLHYRDVTVLRPPLDARFGSLRVQHPPVEVEARPPRSHPMVKRVYKIWAYFERLHAKTSPPESGHKPYRDGGLADTALGARDQEQLRCGTVSAHPTVFCHRNSDFKLEHRIFRRYGRTHPSRKPCNFVRQIQGCYPSRCVRVSLSINLNYSPLQTDLGNS